MLIVTLTLTESKSIYLNKSLDTQVPEDTDACPTKENTTMKHTGLSVGVSGLVIRVSRTRNF